MLSRSNQEPLRQYFCPKVDNVRMVYDAGDVMQAVVYDPSIIQSERKGSAKDLPIQDIIDTFGKPSIVYESEGTVFFAYPSKGVEVRLWKEFDLTDSSFDPYSWPEHFPESTYAEYVLLFAPMSDSQFREIYIEQYSPYQDVDWQGIGNK